MSWLLCTARVSSTWVIAYLHPSSWSPGTRTPPRPLSGLLVSPAHATGRSQRRLTAPAGLVAHIERLCCTATSSPPSRFGTPHHHHHHHHHAPPTERPSFDAFRPALAPPLPGLGFGSRCRRRTRRTQRAATSPASPHRCRRSQAQRLKLLLRVDENPQSKLRLDTRPRSRSVVDLAFATTDRFSCWAQWRGTRRTLTAVTTSVCVVACWRFGITNRTTTTTATTAPGPLPLPPLRRRDCKTRPPFPIQTLF